ncbi:alanine--tRNA ligase [Myxococcota bacterium]|nr:alanine--tRNA ligase [Myxococcota bacterium]MBU1379857.1 alanine--tRNA ligase [Myxococcota bacterium]MBU1498562.1 alanine--tRNA ligase [Myxococcota bacterium]
MTAEQIRKAFLDFFRDKGHTIVDSAPCFPADDPTLLFTNAGMNQFKDVFLGAGTRNYTRAADTQKCIRVSGKHNDLEEVGYDTYHHTFFEMLGNWSFGDYFKKEAIRWSWEFLTEVVKLDRDKLYVTVFKGDKNAGLEPDSESFNLWASETGIPEERILYYGAKENFWEMGDTGPCGPCTEIHVDRGPAACDRQGKVGHECSVNGDCARYIEIWNNVFIQYNRLADGRLEPLPKKHVDTGMGFERLVSTVNGKLSNYDTDLFSPLFEVIGAKCGVKYGSNPEKDIAFRVIADHARTLSIAVSDGVMPGNTGRGYVLRRLLRRALRYARQNLGITEPLMYDMAVCCAGIYDNIFPEIRMRLAHLKEVLGAEEAAFVRTIDRGIERFQNLVSKLGETTVISGADAFDLYSTYGFPRDLIELMAREQGFLVDEAGWNEAQLAHEQASAGAVKEFASFNLDELADLPPTVFLGYPCFDGKGRDHGIKTWAKPLKLVDNNRILVLDKTVFYAESGGQVGDTGVVSGDGFRFVVEDTKKMGDYYLHMGSLELSSGSLPSRVEVAVNEDRRRAIMGNHSATHLLHRALHEVVGPHATQQGSSVEPDKLRFDFTHHQKLSKHEIEALEVRVNRFIREDAAVETLVTDTASAKESGAMAIFGEKYGERVRVVSMGEISKELCGGTHVLSTGEIGTFIIEEETALAAGVRRITALTGAKALEYMQEKRTYITDIAATLKSPQGEIIDRIAKLQDSLKDMRLREEERSKKDVEASVSEMISGSVEIEGTKLIVRSRLDLGRKEAAMLVDLIRSRNISVCGVIAGADGDTGVSIVTFASKDLASKVHCGNILKETAPIIGGRGGGRPDFAQGGGADASGLEKMLAECERLFKSQLGK